MRHLFTFFKQATKLLHFYGNDWWMRISVQSRSLFIASYSVVGNTHTPRSTHWGFATTAAATEWRTETRTVNVACAFQCVVAKKSWKRDGAPQEAGLYLKTASRSDNEKCRCILKNAGGEWMNLWPTYISFFPLIWPWLCTLHIWKRYIVPLKMFFDLWNGSKHILTFRHFPFRQPTFEGIL